jgi:hypothetical protein
MELPDRTAARARPREAPSLVPQRIQRGAQRRVPDSADGSSAHLGGLLLPEIDEHSWPRGTFSTFVRLNPNSLFL